jgi:hypothetical protein
MTVGRTPKAVTTVLVSDITTRRRTQKTQTVAQPISARMSRPKPRDAHTSPTGTYAKDGTSSAGTCVGDQYGRTPNGGTTYVHKAYSCFDCDHPRHRYRYSPKTTRHECARCKNKSRQSVRCTEIRAEDAVSGFILISRIPLCVPCQRRADSHEFDTHLSLKMTEPVVSAAVTVSEATASSEAMAKTVSAATASKTTDKPVVSEAVAKTVSEATASSAAVMTDKPVVSEATASMTTAEPLQAAPSSDARLQRCKFHQITTVIQK